MKQNKEAIFNAVILAEGPYSNDPGDDGGMTTWGITSKEVAEWRGRKAVTSGDMKAFSQDEAKKIYDALYWKPLQCEALPSGVDYAVFDAGLLHGIVRAAKWLQRAVGTSVDGKVGPLTLEAVGKHDPLALISTITKLRRRRALSHPDWPTFGRGWTNRITRADMAAKKLV